MISHRWLSKVLVWANRPGSVFETVAYLGGITSLGLFVAGRTSFKETTVAGLSMFLLWTIGRYLRRRAM